MTMDWKRLLILLVLADLAIFAWWKWDSAKQESTAVVHEPAMEVQEYTEYNGGYFVLQHKQGWNRIYNPDGKLSALTAPEQNNVTVVSVQYGNVQEGAPVCDVVLHGELFYTEEQELDRDAALVLVEHYGINKQEQIHTARVIWGTDECVVVQPKKQFGQDKDVQAVVQSVKLN